MAEAPYVPVTQQNPFGRGYGAIVAALEGWAPLAALVKKGNEQTVATRQNSPGANKAQRPAWRLTQMSHTIEPYHRNSKAIWCKADYKLEVNSGELTSGKLDQLVWEVGRALTNASADLSIPDILSDWHFKPSAPARPADPQMGGIQWSSIFTITLDFSFVRSEALANTYTI